MASSEYGDVLPNYSAWNTDVDLSGYSHENSVQTNNKDVHK